MSLDKSCTRSSAALFRREYSLVKHMLCLCNPYIVSLLEDVRLD